MGAIITLGTHGLGESCVAQVLDPKTLGHDETIEEAIKYGHVIGKKELISANCRGVLKSMIDGISKDGDGRKIDALFSVQPFSKGRLEDITDDVTDAGEIEIVARARALKDLQIDPSAFTVIIEGSTGDLTINSISTGEKTGEIVIGEAVNFNGVHLEMKDGDSVSWYVPETDKRGTVPASAMTSDWSGLTIAPEAFAELNAAEFNEKIIVFKLAIGNLRATRTALLVVA